MAKIRPIATIESMSGKVCKHSDMYFRTTNKPHKYLLVKSATLLRQSLRRHNSKYKRVLPNSQMLRVRFLLILNSAPSIKPHISSSTVLVRYWAT